MEGEGGGGKRRTVIEAVENIEKHGPDVAGRRPILAHGVFGRGLGAGVLLLPRVSPAPDDKGEAEENRPHDLRLQAAPHALHVQGVAEDEGAPDLAEPVEHAVEGAGADVELGRVEVVELVGVEPVAGEEHGKEEDDPGVGPEDLVQADDLALPGRVLHEDDVGAVAADDVAGVDEGPGEAGADEGEDHEADVGSVRDRSSG